MNRPIWIVGLIALGAIIFFLARSTDNGNNGPPPPPVPSPRPEEPKSTVMSLQCPICQGYGHITTPGMTGTRRRICQFCGGKGGKVLRIPPGNVRCPECQGFGRVGTAKRYFPCPRCKGRGYIKKPFQPPE